MGKQSGRSKDKGKCAYCGVRQWTTRDHVVPQQLFPKPHPPVMVTVGACEECNRLKKPHDDYLRDSLLADIGTSDSPVAASLRAGAFKRSIEGNHSRLAREAFRSVKFEPAFTPSGIFLGHYPSFEVDTQSIRIELAYIARGLFYKIRKKSIPHDYAFEVRRVDGLYAREAFRMATHVQTGNIAGSARVSSTRSSSMPRRMSTSPTGSSPSTTLSYSPSRRSRPRASATFYGPDDELPIRAGGIRRACCPPSPGRAPSLPPLPDAVSAGFVRRS
jgi:hypothetical protein